MTCNKGMSRKEKQTERHFRDSLAGVVANWKPQSCSLLTEKCTLGDVFIPKCHFGHMQGSTPDLLCLTNC